MAGENLPDPDAHLPTASFSAGGESQIDETSPVETHQDGPSQTEPVETLAPAAGDTRSPLPARLGRYAIRRVIASGGMGTVYEAEQDQPRRTVALKVMKAGIASRQHLQRFQYESQLLARLRHPAIAEVYDAGTHGSGDAATPFFVMEFIPDAQLITDYARNQQLGPREICNLFVEICDAVHHGHTRGIIHRDLKPQNLLVDADGRPKVIDFGVARMTDTDNYAATEQTEVGQLIGTLQYMSPEQTEADPHDLDTRSDVYSLGLVLYELLTGQRPYEVSKTNLFEATRIVREQPPRRPASIAPRLRGDLETILLKSLAKDRTQRYQSAENLAADIRRYLKQEPITARPPSAAYQLRKFAQRNKPLVAGAGLGVVALLIGFVVSTWMFLVADSARQRAEVSQGLAKTAQNEAEQQRDAARTQRDIATDAKARLADQLAQTQAARDAERDAKQRAQIESATNEAVNAYLNNLLGAASPYAQGPEVTVVEALEQAATEIDTAFADQPRVEAAVRITLGTTYHNLGKYEAAAAHFRRAAELLISIDGPETEKTLYAQYRLARALRHLDRGDEAEKIQQQVYQTQLRVLGEDHGDTRTSMEELAAYAEDRGDFEQAETLLRQVIALQRKSLEGENPLAMQAADALAGVLAASRKILGGHGSESALLDAQRIALQGEHPDTLHTVSQLAGVLRKKGELEEAETIYRQVLDARKFYYGDDDPRTLNSLRRVASVLREKGNLPEARHIYKQVYDRRCQVLGEKHPTTLDTLLTLAVVAEESGDLPAAEKWLRAHSVQLYSLQGNLHPKTRDSRVRLAHVLYLQKKYPEAEMYYRAQLHYPPRDEKLAQAATRLVALRLADSAFQQKNYPHAEMFYRQALTAYRSYEGDAAEGTLAAEQGLAETLQQLGKYQEALALLQHVAVVLEKSLGPRHEQTLAAKKQSALAAQRIADSPDKRDTETSP